MDSPLAATVGERSNAFLSTADDYHKYRRRLNKRLLRLRHELGVVTRNTKAYRPKDITAQDYDASASYGLVLLLTCERDLVHSLEIKSMLEISSDNVLSYKNLMISKLKRAISGAKRLLAAASNEPDDLKVLEMLVYAALNEGSLAVHKRRWEAALAAFSVARCSLEFLQTQKDGLQALASDVIETVVDPSLGLALSQLEVRHADVKSAARKFCHSQQLPYLQRAVAIVRAHDAAYVSEIADSVALIESVTWRGHEAKLYNDEIAYKIMELSKGGEEFDNLILGWLQAQELHEADLAKNQDEDDQEKIQHRAVLLTYISYNLLFTKISRDLAVAQELLKEAANASKGKKLAINKDVARLYASVVQTIAELKELPGVYNDEALVESLENMAGFYNDAKLVRLSNSFLLNERFLESLKVLAVIRGRFKPSLYTEDFEVTSNQQYEEFKEEVNHLYAKNEILAQFSFEIAKNNEFTIESMEKYPGSTPTNLGRDTRIRAVTAKPVLFDVAYNYIHYTGKEKVEEKVEGEKEEKKSFFGIFGR